MFTPGRNSLPNQVLRAIGQFVDKFLYWLLNFIFKIFFQLCNAEYLDNDIVNTLFNNIQLLLSILITFKISFSLITPIERLCSLPSLKQIKVGIDMISYLAASSGSASIST